jgi:serine/threonine-protein kinase HipA
MKCLHCNKDIDINNKEEIKLMWHKKCIRSFFNSASLPTIDLSKETLTKLIVESINSGFSVTGVQKKISLGLSKGKNNKLTFVNYPLGYILKPEVREYKELPLVEFITMTLANIANLNTVPFALIKLNNEYAYISKRIDRFNKNKNSILAMEDFCQLDGRLTSEKYNGSYERVAKIIKKYSIYSMLDITSLFSVLIFSFITGNSDMHLKNFSLIETSEGSNEYKLAPFYDLVSVKIVLPSDNDELALTLNGKKRNLTKNDFLDFARNVSIDKKIALKLIDEIIDKKDEFIRTIEESLLNNNYKDAYKKLIIERIDRLK